MDEIELTQLFVKYAEAKRAMEEWRAKIEAAVLEIGETRKIAGVTATYYKPSHETPDYEGAAKSAMPDDFDISPFSTTTTSVSWKSVCDALFIIPAEGKEKPARVAIK
jgi:hypothetical protein